MNFFSKFFKSKKEPEQTPQSKDLGHLSMEEQFVENFISKGGKFLYSTSKEELLDHFSSICKENNWLQFKSYKSNPFEELDMELPEEINLDDNASVFLSNCEYLIAHDGSVLMSSAQIGERKLSTLPNDFVVITKTSLIVKNKRDALHGINWRSNSVKPTNISTIKSFSLHQNEADILKNYGLSNSKNLYLLLLEDL